jgi:glucosamine kinase
MEQAMRIYLGIDGGGSKTTCVAGNDNTVLAHATSGGSNPLQVGEQQAQLALQSAIHQACEWSGVSRNSVARTCVGIAGISAPQTRDLVRRTVQECVSGDVLVVGDMEVAMRAAFGAGPGVIVIAGTGSIAFGRNHRGEKARAGGGGPATSDEGSGHWIVRHAIDALMLAHQRGENTLLQQKILRQVGVSSVGQLAMAVNAISPAELAGLFPQVVAAAEAGDLLARGTLVSAGAELGSLAATVMRKLWREDEWIRVATAGGVFRHSQIVQVSFFRSVRHSHPGVALRWPVVEPVLGALALARNQAA